VKVPALCTTGKPIATAVPKIIFGLKKPTKPTHFINVSETLLCDTLIRGYTPGNMATETQKGHREAWRWQKQDLIVLSNSVS